MSHPNCHPQSPSVAKRQAVEQRIARKVVKALLAAGYRLNLNNGGEADELPEFTSDFATIWATMFATDEDTILVRLPAGGEVRLQYHEGDWTLWTGDSSYDTDHQGEWSCAFVPRITTREESRDIAKDLIKPLE